jgi:hypothetical protein
LTLLCIGCESEERQLFEIGLRHHAHFREVQQ